MEATNTTKPRFQAAPGDMDYLAKLLPAHYAITAHMHGFHCTSPTGILKDGDAEDEEHWEYVMAGLRAHFSLRFIEVNHTICFGHRNFDIYLH